MTPAITISNPGGQSEAVQFSHDAEGNLITSLYEDGQTTGSYVMSPVQTLGDLGQFFQGLGYTVSVVGSPTLSSQCLLNSSPVDVTQAATFQSASWSLQDPLGSYYHGMYFGGNDNLISNSTFTNINGNGISYRYGNNYTIDNNVIDNDLGGLLNVGGSNITVYNNVFRSTANDGNGINLAYGGNGGTIEFEQNTVAVANRLSLGFLESAAGVGSSNWAIIGNIFENILPSGPTPFEMNIGTTPSTTLANWILRDNVYWVADQSDNPLPFRLYLAVSSDGSERGFVFSSWSEYYTYTNITWGWEQGSLNVDPQLDSNYLPQNPAVIALGAGAVLQNTAIWSSSASDAWSNQASWTESVVGPVAAPGLASRLDDTDTATFDGSSIITSIELDGMAPSLATINFSDLNYTLEGGMLTLNGSSGPGTNLATVTVDSGTQTIASPVTLASDAEMTITHATDQLAISGSISGDGGISKQGTGALTLSGDNTYTGGTVVTAGTLVLNSATSLPAGSSLTIGSTPQSVSDSTILSTLSRCRLDRRSSISRAKRQHAGKRPGASDCTGRRRYRSCGGRQRGIAFEHSGLRTVDSSAFDGRASHNAKRDKEHHHFATRRHAKEMVRIVCWRKPERSGDGTCNGNSGLRFTRPRPELEG